MGKVKATVLRAKNGVITEKRFQDMTPAQWYFHYGEVMQGEKIKNEKENELMKAIMNQLELVAVVSNPPAGKALLEAKKVKEHQDEINADNFAEQFEILKTRIPNVLEIKLKDSQQGNILPVYKRERKAGILLDKGGE